MTEFERGVRAGIEAYGFYFRDENENSLVDLYTTGELDDTEEYAVNDALRTETLSRGMGVQP